MTVPLVAAFALLFLLTAAIGIENRRSGARGHGDDERRSSMVLGLAHTASMTAGALFPLVHVGVLALPSAFAWTAVFVMALAFAFQMWAMRTLGRWFSFKLGASAEQPLVDEGPYRVLRHPGYAAQIVFWLAFAAASRDAITVAVVATASAIGYGYRIRTEERLLAATLGERWHAYARARARLIPWLW